MEEFASSYLAGSLDIELSEVVETRENLQITTDPGIELQEYHWATGYVGGIETTGTITSSA